ncbi:hypothetical protein DFR86_02030 [Acidianus sulfidivorans JP7]|uniref:Nuclease n=1 Tax=Acidianus sulfidivorans JP7 TaxID=619593 RepID=A0A2U9IKE4_9CREN|nr:hypothetical protein [Acidianus sulfidivorans]AWR96446.1 hypothetical protein DFR86_02030 [Acidianus sulfidivorans JP7]
MKLDTFTKDLANLKRKIVSYYGKSEQLESIYERLVNFHKLGLVNLNHSSLELITASYLINEGFKVHVEHEIDGKIIDIYGIKGLDIGIEVETGYVPPSFVSNQEEFLRSRIALKVSRYSNLASRFYIAVPSYYIPPIPSTLLKNNNERDEREVRDILKLIRKYHNSLDINLSSVKTAKIDGIIIINAHDLKLKIFNQEVFMKLEKFYSE